MRNTQLEWGAGDNGVGGDGCEKSSTPVIVHIFNDLHNKLITPA